jgi:hypothetical protein
MKEMVLNMNVLEGGTVLSADHRELRVLKDGRVYTVETDVDYQVPYMYVDSCMSESYEDYKKRQVV